MEGGSAVQLPVTVVRPAPEALPLDRSAVMRYLGYKPGITQVGPSHEALVNEGIARTLAVVEPVATLAYCSVSVDGDVVRTFVPGLTWHSRSLTRLLKGAAAVSLVAATLGPGVDTLVERLFKVEENYALATIVDAAGSALVHGLGVWLRESIAVPDGVALTPLYGPGYGDWAITDQIALTAAAGGGNIGLMCTDTCFLIPQKSLVGLTGWVPSRPQSGAAGCALCSMPDCAYRAKAVGG